MTATDKPATETFQLSAEAAERYEAQFVPAIFAEWAPRLVDMAGIEAGHRVLDVACGTGIVARTAADRLAGSGEVVGLDLNPGMLAVARRVRPGLEWRQGDAADLPFPDRSFDRVLCQMALMFFPDRVQTLAEMARVTRSGGAVAVCVPAALDEQPAYGRFVQVAVEHAGAAARSLLGAYWSCGDLRELTGWFTAAGLVVAATRTELGTAAFDSPEDLAATEIQGSPLVERISDEIYHRIREGAREALRPFSRPDGSLAAPLRAHLVVGRVAEG